MLSLDKNRALENRYYEKPVVFDIEDDHIYLDHIATGTYIVYWGYTLSV
jgi:hypothetical protein